MIKMKLINDYNGSMKKDEENISKTKIRKIDCYNNRQWK